MTPDMVGQSFGRLIVLERFGSAVYGGATWLCRCVCQKDVVVLGKDLRAGVTKSCGCLRKEIARSKTAKATEAARTTKAHGGLAGQFRSEYYSWSKAKRRCTNPNDNAWPDYGGRGDSDVR